MTITTVPFVDDTFTGANNTYIATHVGELGAHWLREYTYSDVNWWIQNNKLVRSDWAGDLHDTMIHASGVAASTRYAVEVGIEITAGVRFMQFSLVARGRTIISEFDEELQDGIECYIESGDDGWTTTNLGGRSSYGAVAIGGIPYVVGTHVLRLEVNGTLAEVFWDGVSKGTNVVTGIPEWNPALEGFADDDPGYVAMGFSSNWSDTPGELKITYFKADALVDDTPVVTSFWTEFVGTEEVLTPAVFALLAADASVIEPLVPVPLTVIEPSVAPKSIVYVDAVYDTFTAANGTDIGMHRGETGAIWTQVENWGQGTYNKTFKIEGNALRRYNYDEYEAGGFGGEGAPTSGGESMILPSGVMPSGITHAIIEMEVWFAGSTVPPWGPDGAILIYQHGGEDMNNSDLLFEFGYNYTNDVATSSAPANGYPTPRAYWTTFTWDKVIGQHYIVRLEISPTGRIFKIDDVVIFDIPAANFAHDIQRNMPLWPLGVDMWGSNGSGGCHIGWIRVARNFDPTIPTSIFWTEFAGTEEAA